MRRWKAALNFWLTALRVDGAMSPGGSLQARGSIWARRPASLVSMAASTTPAMSGLETRWARASAQWRSSAIGSIG